MTNRTSRPRSQGVSFIPLDISEIVQSGVGDSERILAASSANAAAASPSMLFLDELHTGSGALLHSELFNETGPWFSDAPKRPSSFPDKGWGDARSIMRALA